MPAAWAVGVAAAADAAGLETQAPAGDAPSPCCQESRRTDEFSTLVDSPGFAPGLFVQILIERKMTAVGAVGTAFFAVSKLPVDAFFASMGGGGVHGPGAGGRHGVRVA